MRRISATLPTLGNVAIDFHGESGQVLEALGSRELERLRQVPHLGVAASVFTGVNHSRLEYALLQCAIISLVAKLHRNSEDLALSGRVPLNGITTPASSGEALLKAWALLSNFGHSQFTYGVERTILQVATQNRAVHDWLTSSTRLTDLNQWCRAAIANYRDENVHFLLALLRISQFPAHDRNKTRFAHFLRNLLLDEAHLFPTDAASRYKLSRLRRLYRRVRLLSMVTLDSYYSHHPLRFDLNAAILSLGDLADGSRGSGFEGVIRAAAGWLADELYLHPKVVAVQRGYEVGMSDKFLSQFSRQDNSGDRRKYFTGTFMWNGFGRPKQNELRHIVRLSFDQPRQPLLGRATLYETLQHLERELAAPPRTYISVDKNRFSSSVHIDILARSAAVTASDIASVFLRLQRWLFRSLEAASLQRARNLFRRSEVPEERIRAYASRDVRNRIVAEMHTLRCIFDSVVAELLPEGKHGVLSEFLPGPGDHPILAKVSQLGGSSFDQITPHLERHLTENPRQLPADRLHELSGLKALVERSTADFILACVEKFTIRDEHGRHIDDWDGMFIEFEKGALVVTIVEVKNKSGRTASANEAFKQLAATRDLVCRDPEIKYRRVRMPGFGAYLRLTLAAPQAPYVAAERTDARDL